MIYLEPLPPNPPSPYPNLGTSLLSPCLILSHPRIQNTTCIPTHREREVEIFEFSIYKCVQGVLATFKQLMASPVRLAWLHVNHGEAGLLVTLWGAESGG